MKELDYKTVCECGVEVELAYDCNKYIIYFDPRLKVNTPKGKIKSKKLKEGDSIIIDKDRDPANVLKVTQPSSTLFTISKVRTEYPKIKMIENKDPRFFSEKELQEYLNKSDFTFAAPMYDGVVLESHFPGYFEFLPGSLLNEDAEMVLTSKRKPIGMWRF